jgi:DNA-binding response OmpR family regulator
MKTNLASPACQPPRATGQCQPAPRQRILVVEDDDDIRRLNTEALIRHGYQVDAAEDGAVAWDALQHNAYDLLVTDNAMPKVTGVELLKKLHGGRMAVPVIMATGTLPEAAFTRYPWLQPAATVLKPYSPAELVGTVIQVLSATGSPCPPHGQATKPADPP